MARQNAAYGIRIATRLRQQHLLVMRTCA